MNTLSDSTTRLSADEPRELLEAQAAQLYSRAPIGFVATLANSLILVGVLRGHAGPAVRWSWFAALILVTVWRFTRTRRYRLNKSAPEFDPGRAVSEFTLGIGVAGFVWGASAVFLFPSSVAHQGFLAFVIGGMVTGATATFSIRMDTFLAFAVPALLPLIVRFAAIGDELHLAMSAMMFLFGSLLTVTAYRVHTAVTKWLVSEDELRQVRGHLTERAQQAETLSSELVRTRGELAEHNEDSSERMRRYLDDMVDSFDTLQSSHNRRLRSDLRASHQRRRAASLATLAQGVAHQLTGPLETISSTLSLAWRHPDRLPSASAVTHMFVQTEGAAKSINQLVQQLTLYASEGGGAFESVDLRSVAKPFVDVWREESSYRGELWTSLSSVPCIEADAEQLVFVLGQLLDNAREAVHHDRGVIEVATVPVFAGDIELTKAHLHTAAPAEKFVSLSVRDNGIGIAEEAIDRIFDPFFTTKVTEEGFGRGFGLAKVAAIVRRHEGEITVESRSQVGTAIRVFLPVTG